MNKNIIFLIDKISVYLATLFGIGYTPKCPGTASCVLALVFYLTIESQIAFFIFTIISVILAFMVSGRAEKLYGQKDCKKIVIDDFSGMLITFLFIPKSIGYLFIIAGFFLFRMLDMLKIPPADRIEKKSGSLGVVGDDVIAGIYSCFILHLVRLLLKISS